MLPTTLSPQTIEALNDLAHALYGICVRLPTQEQLEANKALIEQRKPPKRGYITKPYAVRVSVAYEYARVHYRDMDNSLLSDIEGGMDIKTVDLSKYRFRLEDCCHCC